MHLTLGILRKSQAVFYTSAFSQLDGFAVPAPAQVTQTVSVPLRENLLCLFQNFVLFKLIWVLQIRGLVFSKLFDSIKSGTFSGGDFPNFIGLKIGSCFWFKKFHFKLAQVSKIGFVVFGQGFGRQAVSFCKVRFFWLAFLLVKSGFQNWLPVFSKSFGEFSSGFFARFVFSRKFRF